ncbi:uncharacterized protein LOC109821506 [Asparagus officinalis]|uniref:uncharacterized protein LOC109821506 n=1 Tax=Asparagus officinalis TaxID=4686 RepID=UPI00098E2D23|nr:uncharacterized protein LOC109821506 [Asparagus officinalis]
MLLQFLNEELLPGESTLPNSYDEAKKLIRDLGLSYEKIDSCPFSCMLFWKSEEGLDTCQRCGASRWKLDKHGKEIKRKSNGKKIPQKTLRYFPLKPRLQRLYMSSKTASDMRWHHERQVEDGVMRHPADSKAWKNFNELHESFAKEPRNVRLGLACDGFQPFTNSKVSYSIWPVLLVPYNLPPWMCMKQSNFILSMLIPGLTGPGDAIDTYLQPLIEELKELWASGVQTYDVSLRQNFILHAALILTINDFPAYTNLSGWSTKGKLACPCCNKHTHSIRLKYGGKQSYMGHRRYLDENHIWRKDKKSFDGTRERGYAAPKLTGYDILKQRLIPVSIRGLLPAKVCEPIIELSIFFTILCAKTLRVDELKQIDEQIPLTLCKLEKIFPPSIFNVMLHLVVHLASEAILGGPVRFRWMYPVERFETKFNRLERNYEDDNRECNEAQLSIFGHSRRALGAATTRYLDEREWLQAHIYILKNCDEVQPHIEDYNEFVREPTNHYDDKDRDKNFIEWFQALVYQSYREDDDLLSLSRGPSKIVKCFTGFVINGHRFYTESRDNCLSTQNSGVAVVGDAGDGGDIDYYGALVEVVELEYPGRRKVVLFCCKWWDVHGKGKGTALKEDKYGFINWHVVLKAQPRDSYDMPPDTDDCEITDNGVEAYLQDESFDAQAIASISLEDDYINLRRSDIDPIIVNSVSTSKKRKKTQAEN